MIYLINKILKLSRRSKQLVMLSFDLSIITISFYFSACLVQSRFLSFPEFLYYVDIYIILLCITLPLLFINGLYRAVLKYMGYHVVLASLKVNLIVCLGMIFLTLSNFFSISISLIIIYWFIVNMVIISSRYVLKFLVYSSKHKKRLVGIYGAGPVGVELINNLMMSAEYAPIIIFDDDSTKWGTVINNLIVEKPININKVIRENKLDLIILASPETSLVNQKVILRKIANSPIELRTLSNEPNNMYLNINLGHSKRVQVEDILGRDPIKSKLNLLDGNIKDKNVLVTGAGGSIGGELCRQIIELDPTRLILLDHSEYSLHKLYEELIKLCRIKITPILSSITEPNRIKSILDRYSINTIYHAAAYKHVPMVELNPIDGIRNNILGTFSCIEAALTSETIESVVLISSDKAVRPTNIMGATKRFSELIVQSAQDLNHEIVFSIVRFGNVLDSTGSVVPLFRKQILSGGPVTVTHPKITRYFMSIHEAVHLVIQAGVMAKGGEVFVLEMGDPIKIIDLAKKMIHLNGYEVISSDYPDGDIEIKISGMRPGEKLHEELLIGENVYGTIHPQILQAFEQKIDWPELKELVDGVVLGCADNDLDKILKIFIKCIEGYKPSNYILESQQEEAELIIAKVLNESLHQKGLS